MTPGFSRILSSPTVVVPALISVVVIITAAPSTSIARHPLFAIIVFVAVVTTITVLVLARMSSLLFVLATSRRDAMSGTIFVVSRASCFSAAIQMVTEITGAMRRRGGLTR
uniref:Uncharacterized protein n=1 Tax=Oryza sativa subsp. japonica TaxID=39947 RepID=Q5Z4X1_ORYSJ|nr:hypothetical protein [Oryza sativa Japonica Group]